MRMMPLTREQMMEQIREDLQQMAEQLMVDISDVEINWNARLRTTAGRAMYKYRGEELLALEFNPYLAAQNWEDFRSRTVPHELAHMACYKWYGGRTGHDSRWRSVMRDLGADATRCHSYDCSGLERVDRRPATVICPNCGEAVYIGPVRTKRVLAGTRRYIHTACGGILDSRCKIAR